MSKRKLVIWLALLVLAIPLLLAACGASEPAAQEGAQGEPTKSAEPAATAVVSEATAAPVEPTPTEAMAEPAPTEAAMVEPTEPPAPVAAAPCVPATEGNFAGVDIRGQKVVWWHNHTGSRADKLRALVTEFNIDNQCGLIVDSQSQGSYNDIRDKVNASIASGELPAALVVGYQNDQAFYMLNDSLVNLDTFIDDPVWGLTAEDKADFYPSFFNQSVHAAFGNQRLGFPPNRSMEVLFYNATWLKELGYENPPTTPDEFKEMACKAAAEKGDGTGGYILRDDASAVASWTYAFGGDVLNETMDGYVYNSEATIASITFLKGMLDEGCAFFYTEGFPNPVLAGRGALFAQGSSSGIPFYIADFKTIGTEQNRTPDEVGLVAIPHTTAEPRQNIYGGDVMIVKTSPEQELAAWYFVKWFTSPEIQARWVKISNYFPTRAGTREFLGDYESANPVWAKAADLLQYAVFEPQLISYQAVRDATTQAFNAIMQGEEIQATLDTLTATANDLQAELMAEMKP